MSEPEQKSAAESKVKTLNRTKGYCKGRLTKLKTFLKENADSSNIFKLKSKLDSLTEISTDLKKIKITYYEVLEDNQLPEIDSEFDELEESMEEIKVSLQKFIFELNNSSQLDVSNKVNAHAIKLPDICLPEFDGRIDNWSNFKSQFDSLITNNCSLNDNQRLFYLRSALKGTVKLIETSEDTFQSLMNILIERFENKRLIVNTHILNILNVEKLNIESSKDLRNLIDQINKNLRGLKLMKLEPNELTQQILINIILQKLDVDTRKLFEMSLNSNELPKWDTFIEFLEKRSQVLENLQGVQVSLHKPKFNSSKPKSLVINKSNISCVMCKKSHFVYRCNLFLKLTPVERFNVAKKHKLCLNCLTDSHKLVSCTSNYSCRICSLKHNYLLCRNQNNASSENNTSVKERVPPSPSSQESSSAQSPLPIDVSKELTALNKEKTVHNFSSTQNSLNKTVLLSTAVVWVWAPKRNSYIKGRALLDSASQSHMITSKFANELGLKKQKVNISISGLSENTTSVKYSVYANISNFNGSFLTTLNFLEIPKITDMVPANYLTIENIKIPHESMLADPKFMNPSKIDILIGAEMFFEMVKGDQIRTSIKSLVFQNTVFGYIASGFIESIKQPPSFCALSQTSNIERCLEKFWKMEEVNLNYETLSEEAKYCEEHFKRTHRRDETGRYIVAMPMKEEVDFLGDSKRIAELRLKQLNRKLLKNPPMQELYKTFMLEYETLGHMERVQVTDLPDNYYFLPHHGVYRPEKTSTKLRVVFNASSPVSTGQSLNDFLLKGEVIEDIFDIMTRFRTHKFAFTVDIKQMFRQILIDPSQRNFLRIVWSPEMGEDPAEYILKTVTYGTTCAPFLAIRTLKQLAMDEARSFPMASKIVLRDAYMDDVVSGSHDLETTQELQSQLTAIFLKAGMQLHKWTSNSSKLLNSSSDQIHIIEPFLVDKHSIVKALGLNWHSEGDYFLFKVDLKNEPSYTKRNVLSTIARIYDPLGLLGPIISKAKIFLQKLWLQKLDWEDTLPKPIEQEWSTFINSLKVIESLKIPRYLLAESYESLVILGYADASESAYGAVVYMQSKMQNGTMTNQLIASKSRVAPLKVVSIPRLELSACLLLSKLIEKISLSLQLDVSEIICHTDSTIALAWIDTPSYKLKTFIGNRVSKIQTLTEHCQWRHVSSNLNPADAISRGLNPQELLINELWWKGPACMLDNAKDSNVKLDKDIMSNELYLSEIKKQTDVSLASISNISFIEDFLSISNSYSKLIRVFSFLCRFISNLRCSEGNRNFGHLTNEELQKSKIRLLKLIQVISFASEFKALQNGEKVKNCQVSSLHPFLDEQNVIRVGGRLKNSNLSYDRKFPILLPKNHKLTVIIMTYFHCKYLHVGSQTLLYLVRQEFWPLGGRSTARRIVHDCVICFKNKPKVMEQLMGDLPIERVTPSPPFTNTGTDFCGPFFIRYKHQRKGTLHKIYIAIFICLATRAIHLEIVSDLTTDSFIASLKRFMARRGKCTTIFSDNGTNFVGASRELKHLHKLVKNPDKELANYLTSELIHWKFIPPRAPHFGGLWEAGVKSFKFHLKRAIGNLKLTYEEFLTVMAEVEAILNSRPISPLSNDANDLEALTPAHFLIGRPLAAIVEPDLTNLSDNVLGRWQRTTKITQYLWKRWQRDYLSHCQQRSKWQFVKDNVSPGAMVLVKEENLPCTTWLLGRIVEVIFGKDGKVRVCLVKTKSGTLKRPIAKLAVMPIKTE